MPTVVSYAGVSSLQSANNADGYDMDTVGSLLNTLKAGLENDQTKDTATLVNIVANQTNIQGEKNLPATFVVQKRLSKLVIMTTLLT